MGQCGVAQNHVAAPIGTGGTFVANNASGGGIGWQHPGLAEVSFLQSRLVGMDGVLQMTLQRDLRAEVGEAADVFFGFFAADENIEHQAGTQKDQSEPGLDEIHHQSKNSKNEKKEIQAAQIFELGTQGFDGIGTGHGLPPGQS